MARLRRFALAMHSLVPEGTKVRNASNFILRCVIDFVNVQVARAIYVGILNGIMLPLLLGVLIDLVLVIPLRQHGRQGFLPVLFLFHVSFGAFSS